MEKILTQEEIDDLLAAINSGDIDIESESDDYSDQEKSFTKLDLFQEQTSARWRIANFDIILDAFARNSGISLANRLKRSVSVKRVAIETETFESFLQNLQEHGLIGIMRFEPLQTGGLLIFDSSMSFCLVEAMLGGSSETIGTTIPDRELTSIEINVLREVMDDACNEWTKAFEPLEELNTSIVQVEINPRMVNIVSPETEVLVSRFSVQTGDLFGQVSLIIPYFALEPYKEKLKNRMFDVVSSAGHQAWTNVIKHELMQIKTEIAVQFASVSLPIRDIINLKKGDVIELDNTRGKFQTVLVEQKPKFKAVAGVKNGKKAVRILGALKEEENSENEQ